MNPGARVFPFRWESKRLRMVEVEGPKGVGRNTPPLSGATGLEISLNDLADCIGYPRREVLRFIDRNATVFEGYRTERIVPTPGGPQKMTCLTYEGAIAVLIKVSTERIRNEARRDQVVAFQRWVIETVAALLRGATPQIPLGDLAG